MAAVVSSAWCGVRLASTGFNCGPRCHGATESRGWAYHFASLQAIDEREVVAFMVAGGRVAVVDDHGYGDALLSRFNITARACPVTRSAC